MNKPIRNAIAVVLRSSSRPDSFLMVKRPDTGTSLAGHWGLPAVRIRPGELPEDAARRVCREKLGCNAVPLRFIGTMFQKRPDYDLFFMDIEMLLVGEAQPDVARAQTEHTIYTDQRWAADVSLLLPAAQGGSCCSSIFLTDQGLLSRSDWIIALEKSKV